MSTTPLTLAIGGDHAGLPLKTTLQEALAAAGHAVVDFGTNATASVDYPDFAHQVCAAVEAGRAAFGVLVCGTGIGISIAANRHRHIRAGVVHDATTARLTRLHNNANVLCLGARIVGLDVAKDCLRVFLETDFEGGRHQNRVAKLG